MFFRRLFFSAIIALSVFSAENPFRMGDHLFKRGDYPEALAEYKLFETKNPNDPQVLWRIGAAMTRIALGEVGNKRHSDLETATNYLNRALVAGPKIIEAHLEYARALAYLALFKPNWDDFRVARRVREELVIVIREKDDMPDAYFLMALWHRWVGPLPPLERFPNGLGSACTDSAIAYLNKAIKLDDKNLEYKFELAVTHVLLGNETEGRKILKQLSDIANPPKKFAEFPERARNELSKIDNPEK